MANNYDINIVQGCSLSTRLNVTNSDGSFVNLSGCTGIGYVRAAYSSTGILVNLNPVIDPSYISGIITINLSGSQTTGVPVGQMLYDIDVFNSTQTIQFLQGYFNVYPGISIQ